MLKDARMFSPSLQSDSPLHFSVCTAAELLCSVHCCTLAKAPNLQHSLKRKQEGDLSVASLPVTLWKSVAEF